MILTRRLFLNGTAAAGVGFLMHPRRHRPKPPPPPAAGVYSNTYSNTY